MDLIPGASYNPAPTAAGRPADRRSIYLDPSAISSQIRSGEAGSGSHMFQIDQRVDCQKIMRIIIAVFVRTILGERHGSMVACRPHYSSSAHLQLSDVRTNALPLYKRTTRQSRAPATTMYAGPERNGQTTASGKCTIMRFVCGSSNGGGGITGLMPPPTPTPLSLLFNTAAQQYSSSIAKHMFLLLISLPSLDTWRCFLLLHVLISAHLSTLLFFVSFVTCPFRRYSSAIFPTVRYSSSLG